MSSVSQELTFTPLPAPAMSGAQILFEYGQDAFRKGYGLDFLSTKEAKRGWMAANRYEAEAATPHYAESMGW